MDDRFASLVQTLTGGQTPRVWSLIITIFGDLGAGAKDRFSGALLGYITESIGIKPEAQRVALHRLRKDGWIDSQRNGRQSTYGLTAWGRTQTTQAIPMIYRETPFDPTLWLLTLPPALPMPPNTFGVGAGLALAPHACRDANVLSCPVPLETALPEWLRDKLCDPVLCAQSRKTLSQLSGAEVLLRDGMPLDALQTAVLRVLIVHGWRRIALKAPSLPDRAFPDAWAGSDCRTLAMDLLARFPAPSLETLHGYLDDRSR